MPEGGLHTKESLKRDLAGMGLAPGDSLLFHSSMKAISPVEGGADAVLDALSEYFRDGLLVLPTLSWEVIRDRPPVFDALNTPSIVGLLSEMFRRRPGVARSLHPTHSLAALGRDAETFTADDHKAGSPCSRRASWGKLLDRGGKILLAGCGLTQCTFIHAVEEWCGVPNRLDPPMAFTIARPDGARFEAAFTTHRGHPSTQYGLAEPFLRAGGALADCRFGSAPSLLLDCERTYEVLAAVLKESPGLFDGPG